MSQPTDTDRRTAWVTLDGVELLELDSDPATRVRDIAELLSFELMWASDEDKAKNRRMLRGLLFQLLEVVAG